MENKTIENNVKIALFLGAMYWPKTRNWFKPWSDAYQFSGNNRVAFGPKHLRFHNDWNGLMKAVEKINDFAVQGKPEIRIGFRTHVFYSPLTSDGEREQKLSATYPDGSVDSVYKAVVQFIDWYSQNKEQ